MRLFITMMLATTFGGSMINIMYAMYLNHIKSFIASVTIFIMCMVAMCIIQDLTQLTP